MLDSIGMVDTAARYGQSVYSSTGAFEANQLSAMPSVHVGWAILVAIAVIAALRSRWRWLALLYPVMTTLAGGLAPQPFLAGRHTGPPIPPVLAAGPSGPPLA